MSSQEIDLNVVKNSVKSSIIYYTSMCKWLQESQDRVSILTHHQIKLIVYKLALEALQNPPLPPSS